MRGARTAVILGGGLLALLALTIDVLVPGSAPGFGAGQRLLLLGGVALIAAGLLGRRLAGAYRAAAVIALNCVLLVGAVEVAAGLLLNRLTGAGGDERAGLPYYRSQEWGARYWQEFVGADRMNFAPYMLWRRYPFRGTLVNVDAEGNRVTPVSSCIPGAYTVFMFGGSTLWGTGAPDWGTIPAYVQRGLSERLKRPVCVANFGQSGYVSTQELYALERELQAGRLPRLVVFYDGVNDVFAAYQSGHPGWHQNVEMMAEALSPSGSALARGVHSSSLARLVAHMIPRPTSETPRDYRATGVSVDSLARSVTSSYLQVARMVSALGSQYGFQTVFFWQPVMIVGRKPLTPEEYRIRAGSDPVVDELFTATYRTIEREARDHASVHYIADAFAGEHAPVYIDLLHVTPTGNQRIAEQMLRVIAGR